jgi:16S rRNA G1207 methylase RsmC
MTHLMNVKAVGNKLFLAPLEEEKVHRILDIGTGTGIWAIEMGELYSGAEVSCSPQRCSNLVTDWSRSLETT